MRLPQSLHLCAPYTPTRWAWWSLYCPRCNSDPFLQDLLKCHLLLETSDSQPMGVSSLWAPPSQLRLDHLLYLWSYYCFFYCIQTVPARWLPILSAPEMITQPSTPDILHQVLMGGGERHSLLHSELPRRRGLCLSYLCTPSTDDSTWHQADPEPTFAELVIAATSHP